MSSRPRPILVISDHAATSDGAARALAAGALEVVPKSALHLSQPEGPWATALRSRIKRLASVRLGRRLGVAPAPRRKIQIDRPLRVVGIGASTGGPPALAAVLRVLPATYPVPILVVQHMAHGFLAGLVDWLDRQLAIPVGFATAGAPAVAGVWFAPDDAHLGIDRSLCFELDSQTVRGPHRPSVDMLLESLAEAVPESALGVVLTGMGRDGAAGAQALRAAGGLLVTQDEATSAVFGMPREAARAGSDQVLPLEEIGPLLQRVRPALVAA